MKHLINCSIKIIVKILILLKEKIIIFISFYRKR